MKPDFKCCICQENIAKYTCPRCKLQSCSLTCVKQHKVDKDCNGIRDKTAFIPVKEFSHSNLLSDYRFLEDTSRKASSAYRDKLRLKKDRPRMLNQLIKEARSRGVDLKVLPFPMSRRKLNSTKYIYLDKVILWQVDLVFLQANSKYTEKSINENTTLEEVLKKYTSPTESDPVIRQNLKQYVTAGQQQYKLFLQVEDRPINDKRYYELDMQKMLSENLSGKTVLENPIIHVVLQNKWHEYCLISSEEEAELKEKLERKKAKPAEDNRQNRRRNHYKQRGYRR